MTQTRNVTKDGKEYEDCESKAKGIQEIKGVPVSFKFIRHVGDAFPDLYLHGILLNILPQHVVFVRELARANSLEANYICSVFPTLATI